jgi:hypothetical protein
MCLWGKYHATHTADSAIPRGVMGSSPPRRDEGARPRKRPWYLVLALIGSWIFGASGFIDGCSTLAFYKTPTVDAADYVQGVKGDGERIAATATAERYITAMHTAKERVFPLGIAALLLGGAMVAFSARAMSGRPGARSGLIQVVTVQAALVVATHFITPDIRAARTDLEGAVVSAQLRESGQEQEIIDQSLALYPKIVRFRSSVWLVFRSLGATMILLALTRSRTRLFFEALEAPVSDR